jgi:ribosomal protein S18 acetylase RimI-like enzyme
MRTPWTRVAVAYAIAPFGPVFFLAIALRVYEAPFDGPVRGAPLFGLAMIAGIGYAAGLLMLPVFYLLEKIERRGAVFYVPIAAIAGLVTAMAMDWPRTAIGISSTGAFCGALSGAIFSAVLSLFSGEDERRRSGRMPPFSSDSLQDADVRMKTFGRWRSMDVRAGRDTDLVALTRIWCEGWHDAHDAIVPAALIAVRTPENFFDRLRHELRAVRVIVEADTPIGFVMLRGDEVYQFYVARSARGTGAALALMRDMEDQMAAKDIRSAWLACAVGNTRAARFYEKCGWNRAATVVMESETSEGLFPIQVWRYEKQLR